MPRPAPVTTQIRPSHRPATPPPPDAFRVGEWSRAPTSWTTPSATTPVNGSMAEADTVIESPMPRPVAHRARSSRSSTAAVAGTAARRWWIAVLVPLAVLAVLVGVWAFDGRNGRVVRNVELGGEAVGGSTPSELERDGGRAGRRVPGRPTVRIVTPDQTYETTAGTLGLTLDQEATVRAARREGQKRADVPAPVHLARRRCFATRTRSRSRSTSTPPCSPQPCPCSRVRTESLRSSPRSGPRQKGLPSCPERRGPGLTPATSRPR